MHSNIVIEKDGKIIKDGENIAVFLVTSRALKTIHLTESSQTSVRLHTRIVIEYGKGSEESHKNKLRCMLNEKTLGIFCNYLMYRTSRKRP